MEDESKKMKKELQTTILEKVSDVIGSINDAKNVDQVICALYSLALHLFPLEANSFSGSIDKEYRDQVLSAKVPSEQERSDWWTVFYSSSAFPTLARVLLYDIASNWLACFPFSARKHVYDVFFVNGRTREVAETVIPCLRQNGSGGFDVNSVCLNAERVLVCCLIKSEGVRKIAREFGQSCRSEDNLDEHSSAIPRVAQLIVSIPDKAQRKASNSLSSHVQLIAEGEEGDLSSCKSDDVFNHNDVNGTLIFTGQTFARICRRGSADVLLSELIPRILRHVRSILSSDTDAVVREVFETKPGSRFWLNLIETIKDPYALEKFSEQLLRRLAAERITDVEAFWSLWMLFHQACERQTSLRSMLVDKFLLWKVFPVCCLRWIIQFAVIGVPPDASPLRRDHNSPGLLEITQQLAVAWSKREFVQSAPVEQQASLTAALGFSLEKMSKEDLDATKDVMRSILEGVSCRLENPSHLIRIMASSIALVFSKIIDPANPLYLDDSIRGETIDWEFGLAALEKGKLTTPVDLSKGEIGTGLLQKKELKDSAHIRPGKSDRAPKKKLSDFGLIDPDEIVDPAALDNDLGWSDEEENGDESDGSESSSDSSLQPYDLVDDDTDLKGKFSQLVDVLGALRKSDDPDGVERALDVAEKLVRASPDELKYIAGDLVRSLVQVRVSDITVEGEEESAEEKRLKALVALLVVCPFESVDTLNKLLYSPTVDVSQRIMVLEVMTEAAQELANTKIINPKVQPRNLISTISETRTPWFMPRSVGPAGAGPWREMSNTETPLNWSYAYERELPLRPSQIKKGKTRRWSSRSAGVGHQDETSQNLFPQFAAAFMLPAMREFDKKRQGVDLLGRDFIVLGRLIFMLGVCMKCMAMHPEASALAPHLMDMLSSREISHHAEAYVRKAVLFAASCILLALHPSYVASSLIEGNPGISKGLEWIRLLALHVAESDTDKECYTMAVSCLQLHSEMALQASRALDSEESTSKAKSIDMMPSDLLKGRIIIPH